MEHGPRWFPEINRIFLFGLGRWNGTSLSDLFLNKSVTHHDCDVSFVTNQLTLCCSLSLRHHSFCPGMNGVNLSSRWITTLINRSSLPVAIFRFVWTFLEANFFPVKELLARVVLHGLRCSFWYIFLGDAMLFFSSSHFLFIPCQWSDFVSYCCGFPD